MSKRKWKVYTSNELRDRFQPKPGSSAITSDDLKVVVPNLKRRNSAPPGMIHFPPGTFSTGNSQNSHQPSNNVYQPSSPHHQHELVTHPRGSPTTNHKGQHHHLPYPSRLERRRASLPFFPLESSGAPPGGGSTHNGSGPPSIEAYFTQLQQLPLPLPHDEDEDSPPSPSSSSSSHSLPSFQSLLQTIREDADEEDSEIREIEELANGDSKMQTSKTMPSLSYKDMSMSRSPKQQHGGQPYYQPSFTFPTPPSSSSSTTTTTTSPSPSQPRSLSPSSKFYKNHTLSKSNDNLPSLSRMSISDIIG
jgi:hypothetical protein